MGAISVLCCAKICTPVCGMLHPWCTNKSPAATGADSLRKTFTSFSKQIIWNVKQVPAHRWDVSQSLQLLFLFLLRALAAADSVQKEPKCSLRQLLCALPPLPPFQSPSNCSFSHPFKVSWAAGEKIGKGEVLQMSLLRERIANALKWTFILHRTLMESNKTTFLSPSSTFSWWELFPSQALALSLWLICRKVAQEKTEPWFFLREQRRICSPWVEISAVREPEEDLCWT